jgi:hypothetical protein
VEIPHSLELLLMIVSASISIVLVILVVAIYTWKILERIIGRWL